jgi:hypothetical protein
MELISLPSGLHVLASADVHVALQRANDTWTWYIIRAAGFTAAGLLILLMLSGIGQVTGLTYRFIEPLKAWALHKAMALALCAAIVVHVGFLLIDKFMPFSWSQILVPFVSHYTNGSRLLGYGLGSIAVALGILAAYGVVIVVLSSLTIIDSHQRTWHWLHYLSYFIILAVFVHAIGTGYDLRHGVLRAIWIATGVVLALGVVHRLLRTGTLSKRAEASRKPPVPPVEANRSN